MYFDPALIAHVLHWCDQVSEGPYDEGRRDLVDAAIRGYRKAKLARELSGELRLYCGDRLVGRVTSPGLASVFR